MKLKDYDFQWYVDVDYDRQTNCSESGCHEEGICRCSTIENTRISDVPHPVEISDKIIKEIYDDESILTKYCIDRILYIHKIFNGNIFDIRVGGGYYGEEIRCVTLDNVHLIEKDIDELLAFKKNSEKIEFILAKEYGHILPELKDLNWTVKTIQVEDLSFGQEEHYRKLDYKIVSSYKEYSLPRGICIPTGKKYRLIDGYHRCKANEEISITMIVGEKK